MRKFFEITKGIVYLVAMWVWFIIVSIPLAITLYIGIELVSLIKLIYNQIKSICQRITTR